MLDHTPISEGIRYAAQPRDKWVDVQSPGRSVWAVITASAEKRLGWPLLKVYLLLAIVGIAVVAVSLAVARFQ